MEEESRYLLSPLFTDTKIIYILTKRLLKAKLAELI